MLAWISNFVYHVVNRIMLVNLTLQESIYPKNRLTFLWLMKLKVLLAMLCIADIYKCVMYPAETYDVL